MTHYATIRPGERKWTNLCGKEGKYVSGTLVQESEITCPKCLAKWKRGMVRVARLFRNYRGEE